ncbi:hypothetical protein NDU88_008323 [Pleurodeles waltl]|uniref:Uncharacterized protein n=1 Tax=Pleurodeles waltl TaxID=8319 RepID=A0AAV7RS04_PLEWA|nr:hypothetical protein NDU88_008323 [Pleurodeles waltl]
MDAYECSGGARARSLRPERHNRKPRAPCGATGKCSPQRSRDPTTLDRVSGVSVVCQGHRVPTLRGTRVRLPSPLPQSAALTSPLPVVSPRVRFPRGLRSRLCRLCRLCRNRSLEPGSRGTSCGSPRRRVLLVGRLGASAPPWRALVVPCVVAPEMFLLLISQQRLEASPEVPKKTLLAGSGRTMVLRSSKYFAFLL